MADRRRQIELLIGSRFNWDPIKGQRFDDTKAGGKKSGRRALLTDLTRLALTT